MPAARTRAYAAEGRLAYAPIIEWLRSETLRVVLAHLGKVWLTEVARLLPELLGAHPELSPPTPLTEYWQRQRLFEALARAVLQAKQPLLLLIDDLQWCDQDTLEWLHFLLHFDAEARLLIVGTARSEEVLAEHPLSALLHDLHRADQVTELELETLDLAETTCLARQVAGLALEGESARQIYRDTLGNPLFVVETVRAGLIRATHTPPAAPVFAIAPAALPPKIYAVIQARLAQLSPPARDLAGLSAAIGRAASLALLTRAGTQPEAHVVAALDELWQRRLVQEQEATVYDFSHDRLRDVAYLEISPIKRRMLHRCIAQALETLHAADLDAVSGQLAAHYEHAGLAPEAITYYHRAGTVAQRIYANEEAILSIAKGWQLLATLPHSAERDQPGAWFSSSAGRAACCRGRVRRNRSDRRLPSRPGTGRAPRALSASLCFARIGRGQPIAHLVSRGTRDWRAASASWRRESRSGHLGRSKVCLGGYVFLGGRFCTFTYLSRAGNRPLRPKTIAGAHSPLCAGCQGGLPLSPCVGALASRLSRPGSTAYGRSLCPRPRAGPSV